LGEASHDAAFSDAGRDVMTPLAFRKRAQRKCEVGGPRMAALSPSFSHAIIMLRAHAGVGGRMAGA